mgnify:CR=1 FL=1
MWEKGPAYDIAYESEIKPFNEIQNDTIQHSFMSDLKEAVIEIPGLYLHYKEHKMVPITTRPLQTRSLV